MMYQTKRTCSRARGRLAWGCKQAGCNVYNVVAFHDKTFRTRSLRIEKRHPKALKVQERKIREKIYICVYK